MGIEFTAEELECMREQMSARAEETEWQLRRELAGLREIEARMLSILGEVNAPGGTASMAKPALAQLNARLSRLPPPPPRPRRLGSTVPIASGPDGTPPNGTRAR